MACTDGTCSPGGTSGITCGTGGWNGPKPGDPDNNSILSATPAFGGIDVSWTLPSTNPYAVAHIHVYRGYTDDFNSAIRIATVAGDFYYDKIAKSNIRTYFYWIVVTSINGTYGDPIGPASAIPRAMIEEIMEDLTGVIDRGLLSTTLKAQIDKITSVESGLSQEIIDRLAHNEANAGALADLAANTGEALSLIASEVSQRIAADEALLSSLQVLYASLESAKAALVEESTVRATADEAAFSRITTAESSLFGDVATGQVGLTTKVSSIDGKVTDIGALYTAKVGVNGLVGGFGVYNDGTTVEAGFDVDRFWVGRTGANSRKPFIIEGSTVYIDEGAINTLTFNKLRDSSGNFIVENGKVKADYISAKGLTLQTTSGVTVLDGGTGTFTGSLNVRSATSGARMEITKDNIKVFDSAGNLRVKMGNLLA